MRVLVTGGAGYIGSHTCVELLAAGHDVHVVDNFYNSHPSALDRVATIAGRSVTFYEEDICDQPALTRVLSEARPDTVLHFAGLKAVGESVAEPIRYFENNVAGTLSLIRAMETVDCKSMVFSSSATVYGNPESVPIEENSRLQVTNPYGRSKLTVEYILKDLVASDPDWSATLLRYFNPVGANQSGTIGEDPVGIPNNLMPFIAQVAVGRRDEVVVFGDDYDTPDGTGVRDYIHVVDLAEGHLAAMEGCARTPGVHIYNLGTGNGLSVLDVIGAFGEACGTPVPYRIGPRRPGDAVACYADPGKASRELGWSTKRDIGDMARDTWKWQSANPFGYQEATEDDGVASGQEK